MSVAQILFVLGVGKFIDALWRVMFEASAPATVPETAVSGVILMMLAVAAFWWENPP